MKKLLSMMITLSILIIIPTVYASDTWDRPVYTVNITPQFLNLTGLLNNETQARIGNDSYLQSQINQTQLDIFYIYIDINDINSNITTLFNDYNYLLSYINDVNNTVNSIINLTNQLIINDSMLYSYIVDLNSSVNSINFTLNNYSLYFNNTIYEINSTINQRIDILNQTLLNDIQSVNTSIKQPSQKYLSYNNTSFYINETVLNTTINNISKIQKYIYSNDINITNGTGFDISTVISYQITEIKIQPSNNNTKYRSECSESGNIIDKDRQQHKGLWDIEKYYSINNNVTCNITGDNDIYNIQIIYLKNGL